MPRVVHQPRAGGKHVAATTVPLRIPLNDDRDEKAARLQSRQALQEMQMNSIKAAASPARKRRSLLGPGNGGQGTPINDDDEGLAIGGNAVTPMKRVPILADFEEWMKMATDNKINAANSWNFALIDYFHDMSLLKEGDGVNFQKASCTLDGCVKIYTSRVDSVATETGKLLSGLAVSGNKKRKGDDGEEGADEEGKEDEDSEDGITKKRAKKKMQRSEATLASSFAQLQLKKMEMEFAVDPLFKKASADFDEGGAKGLLLNHLSIDAEGRIVFDSSDDAQDVIAVETNGSESAHSKRNPEKEDEDQSSTQPGEQNHLDGYVDISSLASKFFPDLSILDDQEICPSLKTFSLGDPTKSFDIPFLKAAEEARSNRDQRTSDPPDDLLDDGDAQGLGFGGNDNDDVTVGFDIPTDVGFGEGGEAWVKGTVLESQLCAQNNVPLGASDHDEDGGFEGEVVGFDPHNKQYSVTLSSDPNPHENILSYFDTALQKNWAGPEHWRIKRIKDARSAAAGPAVTKRKEKQPFKIDFAAPTTQALADALYTRPASASAITLPKAQWRSRTRNLLPDDKHFHSQDLIRLFLKPKARVGGHVRQRERADQGAFSRAADEGGDPSPAGEMDEQYWARRGEADASARAEAEAEAAAAKGSYDANFFQDDGLGVGADAGGDMDDDNEFADAHEAFSPGAAAAGEMLLQQPGGFDGAPPGAQQTPASSQGPFGTQLVTQSRRVRPEYVQYAKVAKKVDVRRLKEEMWRGIGFDDPNAQKV